MKLIWTLLRTIGQLPDEIIVKILYEFRGLEHPLVKKLLDSTRNRTYEDYQKLSVNKVLEKIYREDCEVSDRMLEALRYHHEKVRGYYQMMYINYTDPGYYMKRKFGKLVYEIETKSDRRLYRNVPPNKYTNYDGDFNSNYTSNIGRYWKLNRSVAIINKLKCMRCDVKINFWSTSKFKPSDFATNLQVNSGFFRDKQITYTELLKEIEDKYDIGYKSYDQCMCFYCKGISLFTDC